ncbi:hypothetical protein OO015_00540 [Thermomicrobium sp. 4228-Ro]|uniref:hypothetical protein n=1 Tax=Thermomicrobium sp. 4228-Ro TaxID=2993937 RepID=UPI002248C28E|nr:hypothetical protein [Thermomicrobium sp. 4228-Ro]MCX2725995.1 hypothetical protein [Thermomicrobium sp. 4228-Ro]
MEGFIGSDLTVVADLPGTGSVVVTARDSLGEVVSGLSALPLGGNRFAVTVPASRVTVPGLWEVTFTRGSIQRVIPAFVGNPSPVPMVSLYDLLAQVASQHAPVIEGEIRDVSPDGTVLVDETLPGGSDTWVQHRVVIHPEDDMANGLLSRVVASSSGGALTLVSPFPAPVVPGTRYLLLEIAPSEVLRAIRSAVAEYANLARVRLDAPRIPVSVSSGSERGVASIPSGFTHIYEVHTEEGLLPDDAWSPAPGRKLLVPSELSEVLLRGLGPLTPPVQPHSRLPVEPLSLVSLASVFLHAARSRGPGIDVEEHLRRLMVALQVADGSLHRLVGRVPHGAVAVLP